VLGSAIYKFLVDVFSNASTLKSFPVEACLDTGGGCNLVRKDALPTSTEVRLLSKVPKIAAAQGQQL
jgi:hypothetical protein